MKKKIDLEFALYCVLLFFGLLASLIILGAMFTVLGYSGTALFFLVFGVFAGLIWIKVL